jgi:capsular exopolysaccharide synthesis family protein
VITSAVPQEGKSVFAANLATTIAQDGKRVLLVDADLRRPQLQKAFNLKRDPGLTNMLVEGRPLSELVQSPRNGDNGSLENLHVLCAGSKTPNPAELLGGEAMAKFAREAREQYDMVIYDMCPAMFVADAAPLSSGADGVVMVLKAAKTRRGAAGRARRQLEAVDGKIIGAVLTNVRPKAFGGYGYYGYGYGYGYGYYDYDYHRYYREYADDQEQEA